MTPTLLALLMFSGTAAEAAAPARPAPNLPLRARLTDEVIRQAVRDTRAEQPVEGDAAPSGQVLSGDRAEAFSRAFSYAQKPSCMGSDALKFEPAEIYTKHASFVAKDLMALPFWASAILKGKCK